MRRNDDQAWRWSRDENSSKADPSPFEQGFALALFLNDAHFGGDGKQPQVTLRINSKEEGPMRRMLEHLPAGRLYGPYEYVYKDGHARRFHQLMYRGVGLTENLIPFLDALSWEGLAPESYERYQAMRRRYRV